MKVNFVVPVYNGGEIWEQCAASLHACLTAEQLPPQQVLVIDSSSRDNSRDVAARYGFRCHTITSAEFNHGGTRNLGVAMSDGDVVVFLTQDAIPQHHFICELLAAFEDEQVAVAYGRQLPHDDANPLACHARRFNYSTSSHVLGLMDKSHYGIKTVFTSNSFAAYRAKTFHELGGFPSNTILSEDMYLAAQAVLAGYRVAYVADAAVKHSHNYTPVEEFKRYFDIGVFHCDEKWIREEFGGAGGEGKRFIFSELRYLMKENNYLWIPRACVHNALKIAGYKLGQHYRKIPHGLIRKLSMHKRFWQ
ncbi:MULTISPECIES: glycosyltransferase family 2 protein [Dickeya]|uniref:Glycosyltransferase family 2 protein n=1 Tax=Dickeya fangzhongdai TaxID=1778540 RepID=A0A2K8QJU8_9GAMM|nr:MULTISPECIES: glycosyltransferase family 2 protein [Dickeya]AIR68703.1 rhamnosyltransferase [Dickeya fangzhongdai]ATZ93776.1 glycosyltransferase family 2 protein [Dickeya fangzhongdai]AYH47416.1 rhamnosyltransferase [Dickeya fangzhongdai]KGT96126.1 rhamnosyltransferase [Dickeya fangzhongdai]KHN62637.1 rhamnosyltransferase [Dickeya fangzhongdai]